MLIKLLFSKRKKNIRLMPQIVAALIFLTVLISCRKSPEITSKPFDDVKEMTFAVTEDEVSKYYTEDTVKIAEAIREKQGDVDVLLGLDRILFSPALKYAIVKEEIENNIALVEIVVTNHNELNFIGLKIAMKFKNQDGVWKIDRSSELRDIQKKL